MALALEQIKEIITTNPKKEIISKIISYQNAVKFHTEVQLECKLQKPLNDFLNFAKNLLTAEKYKLFISVFRFPIKTNEITGIIFDKLSKIFDGRNPVNNYQFTNTEYRDDWEYYRQEYLKEPFIWSTKGWDYFKTEFNSVLIVDMPRELGNSSLPEPYFFWLPISNIISYEINPYSNNMEFIIYKDKNNIVVIDNISYRRFENNKDNIGSLISENFHDLGYCPARFFWDEPLNIIIPDIKYSPIAKVLSALNWYLFFHTSKQQLDLYGAYPILSGYRQECNYRDDNSGEYCEDGFLKDKNDKNLFNSDGSLLQCPVCGNKRVIGAGSFVEIPIPGDGEHDLRNPVQILKIDRESLDYNVDEENRLKEEIITTVVGINGEIIEKQSINSDQIEANFENKNTVLNRIKTGFEKAMYFVDDTVCRLRYGNNYLSSQINLGTVF